MATIQISDERKALAQKAADMFNTYAGENATAEVVERIFASDRIRALQIKHAIWQATAMPVDADTSLSTMVHGLTEEAAWELLEAIEQGAADDQVDSLGDIVVYSCAVCTLLRLDFQTLCNGFDVALLVQPVGDPTIELMKSLGRLNHIIGKHRQRTRGYDDIEQVRSHVGAVIADIAVLVLWMAYCNDWDLTDIFSKVLTAVMQRNWVKHKLTGLLEELPKVEPMVITGAAEPPGSEFAPPLPPPPPDMSFLDDANGLHFEPHFQPSIDRPGLWKPPVMPKVPEKDWSIEADTKK